MATGRLRLQKGNFISPDFVFLLRDRCRYFFFAKIEEEGFASFEKSICRFETAAGDGGKLSSVLLLLLLCESRSVVAGASNNVL
jgi:hypothetical protein